MAWRYGIDLANGGVSVSVMMVGGLRTFELMEEAVGGDAVRCAQVREK